MSKEAMKLALEALEVDPFEMVEDADGHMVFLTNQAITALREALANEALDKKAENARELGSDYEPAQHEFVSPGGGYVPAIPAQRQALAEQALDKMAKNARELGLNYELPITMQEGEFDCTHAERLCAELKAAHPVTSCTHPDLGISSLREDGTAARWGCVMCGVEFVPKATKRWAEFNETTKRNIEHAEWYLSTHSNINQQEPTAWIMKCGEQQELWWEKPPFGDAIALYTSPPQRTWVGLTDEEFESIEKATLNVHGIPKYFGTAIEAKLKEKNT